RGSDQGLALGPGRQGQVNLHGGPRRPARQRPRPGAYLKNGQARKEKNECAHDEGNADRHSVYSPACSSSSTSAMVSSYLPCRARPRLSSSTSTAEIRKSRTPARKMN